MAHPSETSAPGLTYSLNYAAVVRATAKSLITFTLNVHMMELSDPTTGAIIGTTGVTVGDVTSMVSQINEVWSQAGIRFTLPAGNVWNHESTADPEQFDVRDGDVISTAGKVTAAINHNFGNTIDVFFVNSIRNPGFPSSTPDIDESGTTIYAGMTNAPPGVLIAKYWMNRLTKNGVPGTPQMRQTDQMARTLAHELGHYLMKRGESAHAPELWNLMIKGDGKALSRPSDSAHFTRRAFSPDRVDNAEC